MEVELVELAAGAVDVALASDLEDEAEVVAFSEDLLSAGLAAWLAPLVRESVA